MATASRKFVWLGIMFSIFAILFAVLYHFDIVSTLDVFLSVTYVAYFVGIALMYNGAYNRERGHTKATVLNFIIGAIFILLSTGMLIYGFIKGYILFWSF